MKITLILFAAAAAVTAQSVDTVSATASGVCEPHNDHWHCPAGVPVPTTPPAVAVTTPRMPGSAATPAAASASHSHDDDDHDVAVTASTCEPHGNHWHCPSGVAEPSTKPAASATTTRANSAAAASASASAPQSPGAAGKVGSGAAFAVVGAVGAWIL